MKIAFMFPGQGSQKTRMGLDYFEKSEKARNILKQAQEKLQWDILKTFENASESDLSKTELAQPLIYIVSCAIYEHLRMVAVEPDYVCGHSLGQFSALFASGAVSFTDGLDLVINRGKLMSDSLKNNDLGMWAVLGLPKAKVIELIKNIEGIYQANFNSPEQTVISGSKTGFDTIKEELKNAGAKRVVELPVGGAFHSPYMSEANENFKRIIESVEFKGSHTPMVSISGNRVLTDADAIKQDLMDQMTNCVDWVETINLLANNDVQVFIEVGPGNVLSNLVKRTIKDKDVYNTNLFNETSGLKEALNDRTKG